MEAKAHIGRHELECAARWREARDAMSVLVSRVDIMTGVIRAAQMFILKSSMWLLGLMATGLVATIWWIITHPPVHP